MATGYGTRSKTTRVPESIQEEEFNKLLMYIVDSMAEVYNEAGSGF